MNPLTSWQARLLPLLAIPLSWWLSCRLLHVCNLQEWLLYQWPSYVACYGPFWILFWHQSRHQDDLSQEQRVRKGLKGLNIVQLGVLLRLAATLFVLLYWKDENFYKPIYIFGLHMAAFFVFQLATLIGTKKSAQSHEKN